MNDAVRDSIDVNLMEYVHNVTNLSSKILR